MKAPAAFARKSAVEVSRDPSLPGEPPAAASIDPHAPGRVEARDRRPTLAPLAPQRYALQLTIGQATHDKLRYAQALLGHSVPAGEIAQVLDRALDALIGQLERRLGFGAGEASRAAAWCESIPDATLEARVRAALSVLAPGHMSNLPRGKLAAPRPA